MRAMTYRGPYELRVEEKDKPRIEHPTRCDRSGAAERVAGRMRGSPVGPFTVPR